VVVPFVDIGGFFTMPIKLSFHNQNSLSMDNYPTAKQE
jgi:hypothetical protein